MPVQQPRIPLWVVGIWPREKSMQRVLKCDGIIVEKRNSEGAGEEATPTDICEIKTYVDANRTLTTHFDIVVGGKTAGLSRLEQQDKLMPRHEVGLTWWIENMIGETEEEVIARLHGGPPRLD
jgi:hypothetical protein